MSACAKKRCGCASATPTSPKAREIETRLDRAKSRSLYGALRCGVQVKNTWIANQRNIARVEAQQPVLDIGVGINVGNVILQQRGDGQPRIEGYAINFAKRVEGYSRYGSYCKIMLSKTAFETFRNTIVGPHDAQAARVLRALRAAGRDAQGPGRRDDGA